MLQALWLRFVHWPSRPRPFRPFPHSVGAAPVVVVDDADFDARWAESMEGIASANVDEAVEHMKLM